jgi:hypothetical protein
LIKITWNAIKSIERVKGKTSETWESNSKEEC